MKYFKLGSRQLYVSYYEVFFDKGVFRIRKYVGIGTIHHVFFSNYIFHCHRYNMYVNDMSMLKCMI